MPSMAERDTETLVMVDVLSKQRDRAIRAEAEALFQKGVTETQLQAANEEIDRLLIAAAVKDERIKELEAALAAAQARQDDPACST